MKFTLVLATVGRTSELSHFLKELDGQNHRDFEIIVVDQNSDNRLDPVLEVYLDRFPLVRLRSQPGLSRARNTGLQRVTGDVIAFPDDDCWYPADLFERVNGLLLNHSEWDGLTGCCIDVSGRWSNGRWDSRPGFVTPANVWRRGISPAIFLRRQMIEAVGTFDETLGAGAGTPWGSGEETDFLLSAMSSGFRIYYDPAINVYHLNPKDRFNVKGREKAYRYAMGMGHVLRKHQYGMGSLAYYLARPLGGVVLGGLSGNLDKSSYYWAVLRGRLRGYASTSLTRYAQTLPSE
jgi:glycosyltransferase involved in cell wall biosynthesis